MSNLDLWNSVFATDPAHTKGFTRTGGFKGTAIKPMYLIHKATEKWGPMGTNWGAKHVEHIIHQDVVYVLVEVWYDENSKMGTVQQWGGDVMVKSDKPNDEALKMAFTDGLTKCLSWLGFSADVHMGLFDDSKYVDERKSEEKASKSPFKNSALRNTWQTNTVQSFHACEKISELKTIAELIKDQIADMISGGNEYDALAVGEVRKQYKLAEDALKQKEIAENSFNDDIRNGR